MRDTKEMRRKRMQLVNEGRALLDRVAAEKRDLNAEEQAQHSRILADVEKMRVEIESEEQQAALDNEMRSMATEPIKPGTATAQGQADEARMAAFRRYLMSPVSSLKPEEVRALQIDSDTAGGFIGTPQAFSRELLKAVDNIVFVRRVANVQQIGSSESLGLPYLAADPADPTWTAEILTGAEDSTMSFGKRELRPHPLAQRIKVSKTLIRKSALNADAIVRDRLAYKAGVVAENGYLNGMGVNQPLGVFTASADGINTDRDVSTGNTTTAIGADNLKNVKYHIKQQYWPRLAWCFHRDAVLAIDKLKDGEGQYLWQPGLQPGQPDLLLRFPFYMSEYAPNTFTTGLYVGILGDWSTYHIADSLAMDIQVLLELYAETNQNGYILRMESDGMPAISEAWARVKLA